MILICIFGTVATIKKQEEPGYRMKELSDTMWGVLWTRKDCVLLVTRNRRTGSTAAYFRIIASMKIVF